ncbi:MAG: hypothetical protein K2Q11_08290, partial [Burkholderiaceae bacterium]|nr:hypothetical protein [Burkholderiaceae bacterium]
RFCHAHVTQGRMVVGPDREFITRSKRVVDEQAFPLEFKVPNSETRAAMQESRALMQVRQARFQTANDLFNDIEKTSQL